MKYIPFSCIILLGLCLTFIHPAHGQERVYLEIGSTEVRKINFAVPWFHDSRSGAKAQNFGKKLGDTLAKALKFHGIINIIPTSVYNGSQNVDWKALGADFAVLGLYSMESNAFKLDMRLYDVANDTMILGKSYTGKSSHKNDMLFRFCDTVIHELTGSKGLAETRIAFVSHGNNKKRKEVYMTDILGRKLRQVTRHKNLVVSPRFVPQSPYMTYTSYHTGNQNLYITDLRQNKTTRVLSQRQGMNLAPGWFPDGSKMLLTLSYEDNPDLYLLNRRGKILEKITMGGGINVSPTLSPDGEKVVFVSDRFGKPQLFLMEIASGKTQRITFTGTENAEPSWHPTQDLIVYSSLRNGVYQICTKKPTMESDAKQLTTDLSHHESPAWSPDGNQIIYTKQDGRENRIYAMMKNGSYQRRLFSFPGNQTYPRWAEKY